MVSLSIHWQQLLWNCYHHGKNVKKDDSEIKELMGNYIFLERPQDLSLPFNKKIDNLDDFLNGLKKGMYDLPDYPIKGEALFNYVNSWKDTDKIYLDKTSRESLGLEGDPFVYTYPERVLHQLTTSQDKEQPWYINQFDTMQLRLWEKIGSNRAVATLYQPGIDYEKTDIPCLNWLQTTVRDNRLELHCIFRSNDLYGAWPSNMYLLTAFGLWITQDLNNNLPKNQKPICFNGIHYHSSSLHIYKTDIDAVENILGEK